MNVNSIVVLKLVLLICWPWLVYSKGEQGRLLVNMTLVRNASALGAYCLDGSLPAYHLHRGFGAGANNWLLQFEGGGWCNDIKSCLDRSKTHRGSTRYMNKLEVFAGILSNNASFNPDPIVIGLNFKCVLDFEKAFEASAGGLGVGIGGISGGFGGIGGGIGCSVGGPSVSTGGRSVGRY
ncbi:putative protein notum -like protein isoform X4 [Capsicum annuum]|nr:putative protein notum -like protein isoform X4 [Capsicum annuum]